MDPACHVTICTGSGWSHDSRPTSTSSPFFLGDGELEKWESLRCLRFAAGAMVWE